MLPRSPGSCIPLCKTNPITITVLRQLRLGVFALEASSLFTGACELPAPDQPTPTPSTATSTGSSSEISSVSATPTTAGSTLCSWCRNIPVANESYYCTMILHVLHGSPPDILRYPVLVFNHNLTSLAATEMVAFGMGQTYTRLLNPYFAPPRALWVTFMPIGTLSAITNKP